MTADNIKIWLPICVVVSGFLLSVVMFVRKEMAERKAANAAVIAALQGEKESVIYTALMAASPQWRTRLNARRLRYELLTALCVAWPLADSSHARAAIFKALQTLALRDPPFGDTDDQQATVAQRLQTLHATYRDYQVRFRDPGIQDHISALEALATTLQITLVAPTATDLAMPNTPRRPAPTEP